MNKLLWIALGAVLLIVGLAVSEGELFSGSQPWGQLLGDNFLFARALPFIIGFGIATGLTKALAAPRFTERRADGALRRFSPSTVLLHAVAGVALLLLLFTGGWQYLKGLLGVDSPIYMGTVYRIHYIAASLLIYVSAAFVTDWLLRGERALTVPKGTWIRNLRGLAHELPLPIGPAIAYMLGLDIRRAAPPTEQFTAYERIVSFPLWELTLGLIFITGILKAMRYVYPIPGDVLYWTSAVHVGAGVLLGYKLLDHLRYVLAPSRWPLMVAMGTTWVNAQYAQLFHPGWYARVSAEAPGAAESAPADRTPPVVKARGGVA